MNHKSFIDKKKETEEIIVCLIVMGWDMRLKKRELTGMKLTT